MFFRKKESPAAQPPKEKSSYVSGREEWLERYGSYIKREAFWRTTAIVTLGICFISVAGNVMQATKSKIVPYVVEVDQLGQTMAVGRADESTGPSTKVIQAELANFVIRWRTVSPDLEIQKRYVDQLDAFLEGAARGQVKEWLKTYNPFERGKDRMVQVIVKTLPSKVSAESWRVEWTEVTRSYAGIQMSSENYQATLTIQMQPPATDAQVLKNPNGIYVVAMSVSTVMDSGAQGRK
ncbi:MAG: Conjugal transfer [Desulfovibrionaceae bacterium]|nr:MAG: Conjugal transfer [Desulfovibrionaceae bacterium]